VIRAFVAIHLPEPLLRTAEKLIADLERIPDGHLIRWVKPQALHLTLVFLGDIAEERVPILRESFSRTAVIHPPFECQLEGLGAFPGWRRPRVLHLGVDDPSTGLRSLQAAIQSTLQPLGFKPERRVYTPHLTLGRVRRESSQHELAGFCERAQKVTIPATPAWTVTAFHFMRSELKPAGPVYSLLGSFNLGDSP